MQREIWVNAKYVLPLFEQGKDLEVRIKSGYFVQFRVGDTVVINNEFYRRIKAIRKYDNFDHMFTWEDAKRIYPGKTKDDLLPILRSFYSHEQEVKGILVFELEEL